ncbi:MAG TPA: TonB-dependent receptor plug domain-containing protein, partial [Stellaceae bacterium]|nr:TonB-dependent receptor plug domain-containing protein [Stellaceae bacterium]
MTIRTSLLIGAALLPIAAAGTAQQAAQAVQLPPASPPATAPAGQATDDESDEQIVVTGQRPRGSVEGDIPPENTLDSRDVRATGATNISELLDALAPQVGSVQGRGGGAPVLLLNGLRVSSFRELRDIPTEAIERVEILPEEVALKYGYRADQKVVNIVLRPRFRSTVAQLGATTATDGGYAAATGDLTRLMIHNNGRTQFNLHATGNNMLTENERDVVLGEPLPTGNPADVLAARSLIGSRRDLRGSAIINRQVFGDVSATVNAELEHNEGRSLIGLGDILLLPLARNTNADSAHLGAAFNGTKFNWHWTLTG